MGGMSCLGTLLEHGRAIHLEQYNHLQGHLGMVV